MRKMKKDVKKFQILKSAVNSYILQRKKQTDYWSVLRGFSEFLGKSDIYLAVSEATEEDAARYLNWLKRERSANTANKYMAILKGIFRTVHGAGGIERSPFAVLRIPPQNTNRVRYNRNVEDSELNLFFREIARSKEVVNVRDLAMFRLLFGHALRINEVLSLTVRDFDGEVITVKNRKAGHELIRGLSEPEKSALLAWLKVRGIGAGFLFCSVRHSQINVLEKLDRKTVNTHIKEYCLMAKIPAFTSHSGRVTAVTRALELGYTYEDVAGLTGHSSVKQVEKYDRRQRRIVNIEYGGKLHG